MNEDGKDEISENDMNRVAGDYLNPSHTHDSDNELSVGNSSSVEYRIKINDGELDSVGANLKRQSHSHCADNSVSNDQMNNENMDAQTPQLAVGGCATAKHDDSAESLMDKSEGIGHSVAVKDSNEAKGSFENLNQTSKNGDDRCDDSKGSELLKPTKSIKPHVNSCRSSIQEVHDSCLRMDVLPNVSPDSGIVSFEGSPFGNESPHSTVGGENSHEINTSPTASLDVHKCSKGVVDLQTVKIPPDIAQVVNIERTEELPLSDTLCSTRMQSKDMNKLPFKKVEHEVNLIQNKCAEGILSSDQNDNPKTSEQQYRETDIVNEQIMPGKGDLILSSPSKISSPGWKKKRSSPIKKKRLQVNHKRSTLYNNHRMENVDKNFIKDENDPEIQEEQMREAVSDSNGNKIKSVPNICKSEVCNLAEETEDDSPLKKKSPGRPKGSLNRRFDFDPPRRTYRKPVPKVSLDEKLETSSKIVKSHASHDQIKKRPRGRPRKVVICEESKVPPKSNPLKMIKKKKMRKRIFTRLKKTNSKKIVPQSQSEACLQQNDSNDHAVNNLFERVHDDLSKKSNLDLQQSSPKLFLGTGAKSLGHDEEYMKKSKDTLSSVQSTAHNGNIEKSDFSDKDFEALLKSVKSSISSQFTLEKDNDDLVSSLSFDNPFKSVKTPSFPQLTHSTEVSTIKPKPKYKKPKLHVMMRKTKRKKKKKFEPSRLTGFSPSSPQKRLSFFTSHVQPSKLLATSRLNVFQTGTGVEPNRSGTPTDGEQTEGSEKRLKKKRKLLNFKTKHRNIIDPVFAADLDVLESGVKCMAISENPADNFIRVRPGEMPVPPIFRVIKIDVMKKIKEKMVFPEPSNTEITRPLKATKKEFPVQDIVYPTTKNACKVVRKKSLSDHASDSKDQTSLSDSSDQWLPPKKRHRMMHIENFPQSVPSDSIGSVPVASKDSSNLNEKRKGRRQKKTEGDSSVAKLSSHRGIDEVLTIDTSSYSTAGSSVSTLTPSPCPSRQSTRSSTIPSVSSLSPAESSGFHTRLHSKLSGTLTCPSHSMNTLVQDDIVSCAECQLLRRSASTTSSIIHSSRTLPRSLSNQSVELSSSFDHPISGSESSPGLRSSKLPEELNRRSTRKRRKSSNYAAEESESSPPRLEKHSILIPNSCSLDIYSQPPPVSPVRKNASPHLHSSDKKSYPSGNMTRMSTLTTSSKSTEGSSHRSLRHSSFRSIDPDKQLCNTSNSMSHSSTSPSVIPHDLPKSDWQPLPLEYCKKKEIVEEIQAALHSNSSDDSSIECEEEEENRYPSTNTSGHDAPASQPPRKRYQRVGLFSDFYKDDEPRKRCENMIRCRDKLVYVKDEHEYGLMPLPIHVGWHYMNEIQDFQLPYDIWWQDYHNQLPKKSEAKTKFRTIRSNVYVDGKASCRKKEIHACSCKRPVNGGMGCLDDCLNRMIYTECSLLNCPLGDNCGNQCIQKHDWAPGIEKFLTDDRGYGVRVTKSVKVGQFILEYLGEVVSETELRRRMMEEYSEECHHYALHLDSGNVIDGYRMGNIGRYVNHSCHPNCEMQKWNVNGLYRMVLFALRDIEAFEELSYDYNFDAFNQDSQQECRCGSTECRGLIGGKAQRNNGLSKHEKMTDDSKDKRKSKLLNKKAREKKQIAENVPVLPPTRTMTHKERCYARKHSMFLVRNVDKVLNQRHPGQVLTPIAKEEVCVNKVNCVTSDVLLANLTESSVKTRLASVAKDNPEVLRRHQLAKMFDKMLTDLLSLKDQEGISMVTPLMSLPSRKKQPQYYQIVKEPIDMSVIKQRVKTGHYDHLKAFHADIMLLFTNVELYCGPKSDMGQVILKLRHILNCVMQELALQVDEILGLGTTKTLMDLELKKLQEAGAKVSKEPEEDIIRCICSVTRDEGLMLQCEKCMRWQHCDCVGASGKEEHYLCDRCEPRYYDPEILLAPPLADNLPDCTHYMTLVKDDVQYAVGDCVYVMRDCKRSATGTPLRSSHRLIATSNPDSLDIFRIEQLWKDPKGERFASGTPYLRPQETFHEPTRKFFHSELFRTPNYEIIPLDLVMGKCVVMDTTTFSKGRPKGVKEQDIYVCEYRVDKTAHLFHKIKEIWYPLNTSRFCFDSFETKLLLKRTFTPHEIPEEYKRKAERNNNSSGSGKGHGREDVKEEKPDIRKAGKNHQILHGKVKMDESLKHDIKLKAEVKVNVKKGSDFKREVKVEAMATKPNIAKLMEAKRHAKRERLDRFCVKLLNNIPGKQKIDLSYLLDGGRRVRKKLIK